MAMKVIIPNANFNGIFRNVYFKNGEGIFKDEKEAKILAQTLGYKIEEIKEKKEKEIVIKEEKKDK